MRRILISQNENNNNTDYVIETGKLISDKGLISDLHFEVTNSYLKADMLYQNDNLSIKRLNNKIIIQSHYVDKDVIGRQIFYMFYIENLRHTDIETIINYLKEDSKVISRTIDENDEYQIREKLTKINIESLIAVINKYKSEVVLVLLLIAGGLLVYELLINKN